MVAPGSSFKHHKVELAPPHDTEDDRETDTEYAPIIPKIWNTHQQQGVYQRHIWMLYWITIIPYRQQILRKVLMKV